jgi:hypothetical protein
MGRQSQACEGRTKAALSVPPVVPGVAKFLKKPLVQTNGTTIISQTLKTCSVYIYILYLYYTYIMYKL